MTDPQPGFDARPLTEPVDPREVKAFAARVRSGGSGSLSAGSIISIVILAIVGLLMLPLIVTVLAMLASEVRSPASAAIVILLVVAVLGGIGLVIWLAVRSTRERRYRLHRFARANGMDYERRIANPPLPGMIFGLGTGRVATDLVRGTRPRFVEFGNYEYTVKAGKSSTTYRWGYVAVKLDVPLPNIVLDAKGNNGFGSNLPASFQREQRLSLEGDFDEYFTLYCPEGYEADALYLFTPDIMARFIDHAAELDAEIVDDWLFLYTKRRVSTLEPETWAWLFGVVGALMTKFDQWARWRDERLVVARADAAASAPSHVLPFAPPAGMLTPPPGVAQQGRRLKRRFPWLPILIVIGFSVFWFWIQMN